jgi:large subunit ribosomal protein L9
MKVILTMDVPDVGSRGQRVDVSAGFARNYLLPRRLAVPETGGNVRVLQEESRLSGVRDRKAKAEAQKIADFLASHEILATLKIGREGRAFGAVTAKDVVVLLAREGLEVDRRRIRLDLPIKRLGVFEIPIAVHPDVPTLVRLFVDQEGGSKDGARREQDTWEAGIKAREEAERAEAEARAAREKEAEEATKLAIERAAARKAREEQAAKAKAEAQAAPVPVEEESA